MKRVSASTLIESLAAMVIIAITVSIAIMVFVSVSSSDTIYRSTYAQLKAEQWMTETILDQAFFDDELKDNNFYLSRSVNEYSSSGQCLEVKIEVKEENGESIFVLNKIVLKDE